MIFCQDFQKIISIVIFVSFAGDFIFCVFDRIHAVAGFSLQLIIILASNASGIPPAPSPPPAGPRALALFLPWMANSRGWGLLSCQIPRGGDERRGQMLRPPSTLQHSSLLAQSNSAILIISMCDFLFQLASFFPVKPSV